MPTARKSAATKSASSARSGGTDAVQLLSADHKEVRQLFKDYESLAEADGSDDERQELAQQICDALTVHAQIEEEIFYPAVREALEEADLVDEAAVEHATAKDLIAQIEGMSPSDELYDAKVKVLGEYIDHHVKEEEGEMFPQARKAKVDLARLGEELQTRKQELMGELGVDAEAEKA